MTDTDTRGLFRKYVTRRVDGADGPGGKHDGCRLFVLDLDHDEHARAALRAYGQAVALERPQLATDLAELLELVEGDPGRLIPGDRAATMVDAYRDVAEARNVDGLPPAPLTSDVVAELALRELPPPDPNVVDVVAQCPSCGDHIAAGSEGDWTAPAAGDGPEVLTIEATLRRRPLGELTPADGVERYGYQAEPEVDANPVRARRLLLRALVRQLTAAAERPAP